MVRDFKINKVKDTRRKFVPRRKIWNIHEDRVKRDFRSYISKYRASSQKDNSAEGNWGVLKVAFIDDTGRTCGWTEGPGKYKETGWLNNVSNRVNEERKLLK